MCEDVAQHQCISTGLDTAQAHIVTLDMQVSFTYPGTDRQILSNVTIQCSLNSRIAIVGPNGAGVLPRWPICLTLPITQVIVQSAAAVPTAHCLCSRLTGCQCGAGKSTMVKLLTGELLPDSGTCWKHPNMRVAYVAQHAFHHIESHLDKVHTCSVCKAWQWCRCRTVAFSMSCSLQLTVSPSRIHSPDMCNSISGA